VNLSVRTNIDWTTKATSPTCYCWTCCFCCSTYD